MSRYLLTTLPSNDLGLLTRSLPIGRELRDRGHQVAFCSPGRAPRRLIAQAGFDNLLPSEQLYYAISGHVNWRRLLRSRRPLRDIGILLAFTRRMFGSSTAEIRDIDHFMVLFGMWHETFVEVNVGAVMDLIHDHDPDVVVDFWNPFACIAARAMGKPLITVIQADMHPESSGFIWWEDEPADPTPSPVPAINAVLENHHLPPITSIGELLLGDRTLVLGIPETDPLPESADVTYVGPILWQGRDEELPASVSGLGRDRPLIWLYPGNLQYVPSTTTFGDSAVVLKAGIEALGQEDVQVVLTTGHHALPDHFLPLPANFHHEPYVPGLAMAEKSDLLIHHGGYGSCQTGLYTGTPALIIPTFSERESNARRIAAQGAGDYVLPTCDPSGRRKQVSADEVRDKVLAMLSAPGFAENARRLRDRMRAYGGAAAAAQLIEE